MTPPTAGRSDADLIYRCLDGDATAWDDLIRRYSGLVYSVAYQTGLSADDAADVLQMVSVTLLDHLRDLRDVSRLMPWIARTTYHHALRVAMRNRRHEEMPASLAAGPDLEASMADLPGDLSERITALHDQQIVREAMALLSPRCRELLTALFLSDSPMSYAEAAQHLDVPVGSIGPTRNRCLQRLRALLDTMDF